MSAEPTAEEIKEFDRLLCMTESPHQMTRISGRLDMKKFIDLHGREKCDSMFEKVKDK